MERIDFSKAKWDQSTFYGRFRHFVWVTDPRSCLVSTEKLLEAEKLIQDYKSDPYGNLYNLSLTFPSFYFQSSP